MSQTYVELVLKREILAREVRSLIFRSSIQWNIKKISYFYLLTQKMD